MVRENIRFSEPNFTTDGVFFYSMVVDAQILSCKVDDGTTAFSYPLDTAPSYDIKELHWDGVFFWSLEDSKSGDPLVVDGFVIRKWAIDDFICKLISTFSFIDDSTHTYRASAFAVEHYRTSLGAGNNAGFGNGYTGVNVMDEINLYDTSRIDVGDIVYFVKRWTSAQNRYGSSNIEQLYVNSVVDTDTVEFSTNTIVDPYGDGQGWRGYEANPSATEPLPPDEVYWTKYLWVFNSYYGKTEASALYKINAYNGSNISQYSGTQYGNVGGSVFYVKYDTSSTTDPDHSYGLTFNTSVANEAASGGLQTYVSYIKGSTCLFYNVSTGVTDRSLLVDITKIDSVTLWDLYDMDIVGQEPDAVILRLQNGTTYKNDQGDFEDDSWSSTYNYDRTLLRRHAKSIAITASPSIVPVTTGSATIVAHVRDQYNESVAAGVTVAWTDDDSGTGSAYLSPTSSATDSFGQARTTYFAGDLEKDVKITAACTWVAS